MDWRRAQLGLVFCLLAVSIASADSCASYDDSAIIKHLRPAQLTYLIIADRHGNPHAISYDDALHVAEAPANIVDQVPYVIAVTPPPASLEAKARVAILEVRDAPGLIAHPGLLAFVPTLSLPKPSVTATPAPQVHDLAWMFAHRFALPTSNADHLPGEPARSQVESPFDINSGGFHGVRTVNGWSAVRVAVSIPCGVSHFVQGSGFDGAFADLGPVDEETGYIYIGGWGAGPSGVSVDAGLQKSSAQNSTDDYAFYWKYATNKPITSDMRFPCGGPDVTLELYPVSPTMLVFDVTGVNADGKRVTITLVQKTSPQDGWIPSGGSRTDGVILKRIVAIAQPYSWHHNPTHHNRFVDGSYFGINGPTDRTPRIVFKSCQIGRVTPPADAPQYRPWTLADTWSAAKPGTYLDWPPLGVSRAASGACDAAGIYLHAI